MAHDLVCAIILNWNGWPDTCACLSSLHGAVRRPDTIVVVDNGSEDDSLAHITAWAARYFSAPLTLDGDAAAVQGPGDPPPWLLIKNSRNRGYAGGNNPAISWALAQGCYDYLWILNNDTLVAADSLARLLDCATTSPAGIFGATVVFAHQPHLVQCAGGCRYNPWTTIFTPALAGSSLATVLQTEEAPEIDYVYGAAMLVRGAVFRRCGLFCEEYFLFYEEMDFCQRARRAGYGLHWCRQAVVAHKVSRSVIGDGGRLQRTLANYHENLSTLIYSWRFHKFLFPFIICFRFFGKAAMVARRREWYLLVPLWRAYGDFFWKYLRGKGRFRG